MNQADILKTTLPQTLHFLPQQVTRSPLLCMFSHNCFSSTRMPLHSQCYLSFNLSVTDEIFSQLFAVRSESQQLLKAVFYQLQTPSLPYKPPSQIICEQASSHSSQTITSLVSTSSVKTIHNLCFPSSHYKTSRICLFLRSTFTCNDTAIAFEF